jgi:endoglucanase
VILSRVILALLTLFIGRSFASPACQDQIVGINLAGPEYGSSIASPASGRDYFFPTEPQLFYYKRKGFNAIRIPLAWEHLQPNLYGPLNEKYAAEVEKILLDAHRHKLMVVLDLHNYDRFKGVLVGTEQVPYTALEYLWAKTASRFKDYPALLAYGIMNEPHHTNQTWVFAAQYGVNGVRSSDLIHKIYIGGDDWSGTSAWTKSNPKPFVTDPANKIVYEGHIYLDDDHSGKYIKSTRDLNYSYRANDRLAPFLNWLKTYSQRGVIGEWGIPANDPLWLPVMKIFIEILAKECLDSFVWAGGKWNPNYILSLEPSQDGQDKLLVAVIKEWRGY